MLSNLNRLKEYVEGEKTVYLYGAGLYASGLIIFLKKSDIGVKACIVSNVDDNPDSVDGVPVCGLSDVFNEGALIIAIKKGQMAILETVIGKFSKVVLLDAGMQRELTEIRYQNACNDVTADYYLTANKEMLEKGMQLMVDKRSGETLFRVGCAYSVEKLKGTLCFCTREIFEKDYGKLQILPLTETGASYHELERVEIYVAGGRGSRYDLRGEVGNLRFPITVGAALSGGDEGFLSDSRGENISDRNHDYSECTALYWIWKNTRGQRYVGLEHYRRRLELNKAGISYIMDNDIDLVVALPQYIILPVKEFFLDGRMSKRDWEYMVRYIKKYDVGYEECINCYEQSYIYISCNLCLFKREWFERYCEFAFEVAFNIEEEYKRYNVVRGDRYMGYIFENLLSLFIMRHKDVLNIRYTGVDWLS